MERYDITIQMYSADASGTQYVWEKVPAEEGDFVLYADAQATIAALQARVQDLEQWVQDQSTANLETMRHMDEMQSRAMDAEQQLTQRTAELEAVKQWKLELCNLTPGGSEFADDPAYCAQWVRKSRENQHNVILDKYREAKALKAELERVSLLSSHNERRFEEVDKKYKELRTLILALPKVEGEVTVRDITALCWANDGTYGSINCKEQLVSLLQERQKLC